MCATNAIESDNARIRKAVKARGHLTGLCRTFWTVPRETFTYEKSALLVCPMCGHEWTAEDQAAAAAATTITDAFATPLEVKGSSLVVKVGTKVKNIRLVDGFGGHDIDCKINGIGHMQLKSEFVKKS